jgi:hypothetical protein
MDNNYNQLDHLGGCNWMFFLYLVFSIDIIVFRVARLDSLPFYNDVCCWLTAELLARGKGRYSTIDS